MKKSARFGVGQKVDASPRDDGLPLTAVGEPELSLALMLAAFDPRVHGGEVMPAKPDGREVLRGQGYRP